MHRGKNLNIPLRIEVEDLGNFFCNKLYDCISCFLRVICREKEEVAIITGKLRLFSFSNSVCISYYRAVTLLAKDLLQANYWNSPTGYQIVEDIAGTNARKLIYITYKYQAGVVPDGFQ